MFFRTPIAITLQLFDHYTVQTYPPQPYNLKVVGIYSLGYTYKNIVQTCLELTKFLPQDKLKFGRDAELFLVVKAVDLLYQLSMLSPACFSCQSCQNLILAVKAVISLFQGWRQLVKFVTQICKSCYRDLSGFLPGYVKVVPLISLPLLNKTKLFDQRFQYCCGFCIQQRVLCK